MNIKNIIFDVGGVLAEPKTGHWFITPNFFNIIDKNIIDIDSLKYSLKKYLFLQTQEPKNEQEEYEMFKKYYYEVLKDINYPNTSYELAGKIAYDCVYNNDKFIFYDDNKEVLNELSKKYNLYIISNGWPSSFRVLKNNKIDIYFKAIIISSMHSNEKEEELFDIFLKEYSDVKPSESFYIDDRRHILEKAKEYNFNTILMDRNNNYKDSKFKSINNMNDIIKLLKEYYKR